MPHARTLIRNGIAALLAPTTSAGGRVFPSRVFTLEPESLPSWSVFNGPEAVTRITMGGSPIAAPLVNRALTMILEGHAAADENVDATLDQLALEAETAMAAVLTVDGKTLSTQLQSTEFDFSDEGEVTTGVVRLTYLVPYITRENTPHTLTI